MKKKLFIVLLLFTYSVVYAQDDYSIWFDTTGIKKSYYPTEPLVIRLQIQNNTDKETCYTFKSSLVTADGYMTEVLEPGLYEEKYSHGGPPPKEEYRWEPKLISTAPLDCREAHPKILPKGRSTYVDLILGSFFSGDKRYNFNLPAGEYYYRFSVLIGGYKKEDIIFPYPITIKNERPNEMDLQKEIFFTTQEHKCHTSMVSIDNASYGCPEEFNKTYSYIDTCSSALCKDYALTFFNPRFTSQSEVDEYLIYSMKAEDKGILLKLMYRFINLISCKRSYYKPVDRFSSFKTAITLLKNKDQDLARSFVGELYRMELIARRDVAEYSPKYKPYLLSDQQIKELDELSK